MSTPPEQEPPNAKPGTPPGDPSMEDILASIRRILSEDEAPAAGGENAPDPVHAGEDEGVFVLDQSMMVEAPTHEPPLEHVMTEEAQDPAPIPEPRSAMPPPAAIYAAAAVEPPLAPPTLVAPEAAAAAASSVGNLVRALSERSVQVHHGGPTLEDLVREEMRPLLKQWLDAHLPPLVERFVRLEIERVVGRAAP